MMSHNKEHGKRIVNISCAINNNLHNFSSLIRGKEKREACTKKTASISEILVHTQQAHNHNWINWKKKKTCSRPSIICFIHYVRKQPHATV